LFALFCSRESPYRWMVAFVSPPESFVKLADGAEKTFHVGKEATVEA
jgi:hypothetical protein